MGTWRVCNCLVLASGCNSSEDTSCEEGSVIGDMLLKVTKEKCNGKIVNTFNENFFSAFSNGNP